MGAIHQPSKLKIVHYFKLLEFQHNFILKMSTKNKNDLYYRYDLSYREP